MTHFYNGGVWLKYPSYFDGSPCSHGLFVTYHRLAPSVPTFYRKGSHFLQLTGFAGNCSV
jgi:hypothetical protein